MIPGLGLVRRVVTLALMGAAFWAGMEFARSGQADECRDLGGRMNDRGLCEVGTP